MNWAEALPVVFMGLMGLAMLVYVVLDGYDLGVGLLLHRATDAQKDTMIASIGPFWDANETWLVLGVGILLIAFPKAHGMVLTALYLPVALMLIGLILRGVAFDFRVKAQAQHKPLWNRAFFAGSGIAAASQGWMLGRYITGFAQGWEFQLFAAVIALLLPAAYVLLGAGWLLMKTEGELQQQAVRWARLRLDAEVEGHAAQAQHKPLWNRAFFAGSGIAAASQGWMLGRYITGFVQGWEFQLFAAVIALLLPAAYVLLGAGWLLMKTEGELQRQAVRWARIAWPPVVLGMGLISLATPWVSETVRARWFSMPEFIALLPIPLTTLAALVVARAVLSRREVLGRLCWVPFAMVVAVFLLGAVGLAYSLFPYVVIDRLTVWQAASATESLAVILIGCAVTVPTIAGYTIWSYRVFWGKARELSYA